MATSSKSGHPLVALAILIAIVGALISEPGILAHTPDGSHRDSASAIAVPAYGGSLAVASTTETTDASDGVVWYPPYGRTLPVDFVAGGPLPALVSGARREQPARGIMTMTSSPAAQPNARPPVVTWNVAPIVTWYGPGFYGGRTACGQPYTRHIVGVASRTLPCGTLVEFRWHGISVVAPVIDRGPFGGAAMVFDLSARLACDLFRERGQRNGCYTRYGMQWRVVGRRRN